jgi:hypothetical protein
VCNVEIGMKRRHHIDLQIFWLIGLKGKSAAVSEAHTESSTATAAIVVRINNSSLPLGQFAGRTFKSRRFLRQLRRQSGAIIPEK